MSVVAKRLEWTKKPLGMEVGLGPSDSVFNGDPALPEKRAQPATQFLAHVYCDQTAGWTKTPLGTKVDLDPGHIVLDGDPAPREMGKAVPLFSANVCCGHNHPSQLLLSSCF